MAQDPVEEWRRLTALYGEMGELEIRELAEQINDLMPTAQQILREEMKKRGLTDTNIRREVSQRTQVILDNGESNVADLPYEYSWKVPAFESENPDEIKLLARALSRAGIERWVNQAPSGAIQILVAADQIDLANEVLAQPISQDIVDEIQAEQSAAAYEIPACPKCQAPDPILESVEPSNNWLCESCGYTWSDPVSELPDR
jgi:hypothetical protein